MRNFMLTGIQFYCTEKKKNKLEAVHGIDKSEGLKIFKGESFISPGISLLDVYVAM